MVQISLNDIQLPDITHINYVFTQFTKIKTNSAHLKIHSIVDKTFLLERLIFRGALKLLVSGNFPPVASSSGKVTPAPPGNVSHVSQFFKKLTFSPRHWNPDPKILVAQAMNPLWKTRCHRGPHGDWWLGGKGWLPEGHRNWGFGIPLDPQKDTIQTPENLRRYIWLDVQGFILEKIVGSGSFVDFEWFSQVFWPDAPENLDWT